jgi:hypothetical protein
MAQLWRMAEAAKQALAYRLELELQRMLAARLAGVWVEQARPLTEQPAMVSRERG